MKSKIDQYFGKNLSDHEVIIDNDELIYAIRQKMQKKRRRLFCIFLGIMLASIFSFLYIVNSSQNSIFDKAKVSPKNLIEPNRQSEFQVINSLIDQNKISDNINQNTVISTDNIVKKNNYVSNRIRVYNDRIIASKSFNAQYDYEPKKENVQEKMKSKANYPSNIKIHENIVYNRPYVNNLAQLTKRLKLLSISQANDSSFLIFEELPVNYNFTKKHSFELSLGPNIISRLLIPKSIENTAYTQMVEVSEKLKPGWTASLIYNHYLGKNFHLNAGFAFSKQYGIFELNTNVSDTIFLANQLQYSNQLANGDIQEFYGDVQFKEVKSYQKRINNIITLNDVPVSISYSKNYKSLIFGVETGIVFNLKSTSKGQYYTSNNTFRSFEEQLRRKTRLNPRFFYGVNMYYTLNERWHFGINSKYNISYTDIAVESFPLKERYRSLNILLSLKRTL